MPKHETLAAALAAFQAELPTLTKDQTAKVRGESQDGRPVNYSYGYADLAQVVEAVSMCLGQHGMAFTATPTWEGNAFILKYALLHEGGEERTGVWPLPDPLRTKPQQVGSAITYARRYAQMAVTNTFPGGEDDDGAAAVPGNHRDQAMTPDQFENLPKERPDVTAQQAHDQHRRGVNNTDEPAAARQPKRSWSEATDVEVGEQHRKLETIELADAVRLYDWMAGWNLHNRKVKIANEGGGDNGTDPLEVTASEVLAFRLADDIGARASSTLSDVRVAASYAEDRGLLKIQVSETETLDQVLADAKERLALAEASSTSLAQQQQAAAEASWDPQDDASPGSRGSSNG